MSRLTTVCKALKLGDLAEFVDQVIYRSNEQYLTDVLELALQQREARRIDRLVKQASFPMAKTLDNCKFDPITFPKGFSKERLVSLDFIKRKENVLCIGAVGTGKTHLAIALGVKACMEGWSAKFYRAVDLSTELAYHHRQGTLTPYLKRLEKVDLLILDELGYIPFDRTASQLLFNVISNSYERQSVIVTSNLEFGRWNQVFGDDRLTAALVDRLVHHAHILAFTGQSYRYRQAIESKEDVTDRKQ